MPENNTREISGIPKLLSIIILAGACCLMAVPCLSGPPSATGNPVGAPPGNETEIKELVENFSSLPDCHVEEFHWFGLKSDQETELMVHYRVGDRIAWFTDIFSFADHENPSRLYHGDGHVQVLHCRYDDTNYLFTYIREGSGGFLSGILFSWDGVGPLTAEYHQDSNFQGWVAVAGGRLCFSNDFKYYRLEKAPAGFQLVEYSYEVNYPDLGRNVHVLKAVKVTPDSLAVTFDGRPVSFVLTQDDKYFRGYGSRDTMHIGLNEEIMVIGSGCAYADEDFQGRASGLIGSYVPRKKGDMWLSMGASHSVSFNINFKVSNPIIRP